MAANTLAFANALEYLTNTKLQTEIPYDLKHDFISKLMKYGDERVEVDRKENEQWRTAYFKLLDDYNRIR